MKLLCSVFYVVALSLLACGPGSASTDESISAQESPEDSSPASNSSALFGVDSAFQANTGNLWIDGKDTGHKMAAGTNAAIRSTSCYAFQANTGQLVVVYNGVPKTVGAMAPKTSPSATTVSGGECVIAAQGSNGSLYTYKPGTGELTNQQLGMAPRTSPSITNIGSTYLVAFQANTGSLFTLKIGPSTRLVVDNELGMAAESSPSIATVQVPSSTSSFYSVIAFRANTGQLYTVGPGLVKNWGLGIAPGTSPSISNLTSKGGYIVAFSGSGSNDLWTVSNVYSTKHWPLGMASNTSPVISGALATKALFQANTGHLYELNWNTSKSTDLGFSMAPNTSPSMN